MTDWLAEDQTETVESPNSAIKISYSEVTQQTVVTHQAGDNIRYENIYLEVDGEQINKLPSKGNMTAGSKVDIGKVGYGKNIKIVWENDDRIVLAEYNTPEEN